MEVRQPVITKGQSHSPNPVQPSPSGMPLAKQHKDKVWNPRDCHQECPECLTSVRAGRLESGPELSKWNSWLTMSAGEYFDTFKSGPISEEAAQRALRRKSPRNGKQRPPSACPGCPHSPHSYIKVAPKEASRSAPVGTVRIDSQDTSSCGGLTKLGLSLFECERPASIREDP